jgi:transposase
MRRQIIEEELQRTKPPTSPDLDRAHAILEDFARFAGYAAKRARNKRCRGMARNLLKAWPALWSFAKHDGVQPTNNHAERALRSAVIYRKLSLGTQSRGGERRIERLLSAHTTCRLQHRSLHDYLTELLTAHARGDPIPLLT